MSKADEKFLSVIAELTKELGDPISVETGAVFFSKNDCEHEIYFTDDHVFYVGYTPYGCIRLEQDKLAGLLQRLRSIVLCLEIRMIDTKTFEIFPRLLLRSSISTCIADIKSCHNTLTKAREIVDEFRVYDKRFESLEGAWQQVNSAAEKARKGKLLEQFLCLLMNQDGNFEVAEKHIRTKSEEIDLVVENSGRTFFYSQLRSPLFLVECKNWSSKIGAKEVRDFAQKVQNRPKVLCSIGVLVTTSELTKDASEELIGYRGKDFAIVVLEGNDIEAVVTRKLEFGELLKRKFREAGLR